MKQSSRTTRNLLAACRSRLAVVAACLLALTASLDPQDYVQSWFGGFAAAPVQGSDAPDDNDDEMLDTTGLVRSCHQVRRQHYSPSDNLPHRIAWTRPPRTHGTFSRPATADFEHDFRNGLGAPLLC